MNDEIKIDKNISIPKPRTGGNVKWPFDKMEIGDSFLAIQKTFSSASALAVAAGYRLNRKFSCRKTEEGIRIWRIK